MALLLLCAWCACCACSDASTNDSGLDAALDGGPDANSTDARRDTSVADSRLDSPVDSGVDDPGWLALPDQPTECVVEAAAHPERVATLTLIACSDPSASCRRVSLEPVELTVVGVLTRSSGMPAIAAQWSSTAEQLAVVFDGAGDAVAAWRAGPPVRGDYVCSLRVALEHERLALLVVRGATSPEVEVRSARLDELDTLDASRVVFGPAELAGGFPQRVLLGSDGTLAGDLQMPTNAFAIGATGALRILTGSAVTGLVDTPSIVGSDLFWTAWDTGVRVAFGSPERDGAIFYSAAGAEVPWFLADESGFAWYEGRGARFPDPYTSLELWTAEYTNDPALLMPRLLRSLPPTDRRPMALGDGIVARWRSGVDEVEVVDLADARLRHYTLPSGYRLDAVRFVSSEEVWVSALEGGRRFVFGFDPREVVYDP